MGAALGYGSFRSARLRLSLISESRCQLGTASPVVGIVVESLRAEPVSLPWASMSAREAPCGRDSRKVVLSRGPACSWTGSNPGCRREEVFDVVAFGGVFGARCPVAEVSRPVLDFAALAALAARLCNLYMFVYVL